MNFFAFETKGFYLFSFIYDFDFFGTLYAQLKFFICVASLLVTLSHNNLRHQDLIVGYASIGQSYLGSLGNLPDLRYFGIVSSREGT